ncbi:MAG: DNA polymerase III subunit delta' [Alphaproteobacteria bacterium]|nr:DNA polymerase III subunit delta' [Alphaproteobacteria bacterium]
MDLFGDPIQDSSPDPEDDQEKMVVPQADSLAPPLAREARFCLGQDRAERILLENLISGRLPHGLIFSGPKGIGKAVTAFRLAKYILSRAPSQPDTLDTDPLHPVVRRLTAGAHPDFMLVERAYDPIKNKAKDSVSVSEIRKIPSFLRMTASEGGWRIVIVDDADTMNRNAQNALLKSLEEPPPKALLILIAHRAGNLIPTIRSRTQTINFPTLQDSVIKDLLSRFAPTLSPEDRNVVAGLAQGSMGRALQLAEQGGIDLLARISEAPRGYPSYNWPALHALADEMARPGVDSGFLLFQNLFLQGLGELAGEAARGKSAQGSPLLEAFQPLFRKVAPSRILELHDKAASHFENVKTGNLDSRQAVLGAFFLLADL